MAILEESSDIPPDEKADMEEVWRLVCEGKRVTDPALRQRIHERAERARREDFERHGLTNIAVDLIREARDEE
jgi:hypothetical protein